MAHFCIFNFVVLGNSTKKLSNSVHLIQKIGHPIAEIRQRALKTIQVKLDHEFLYPTELLSKQVLFYNLISTWFSTSTENSDNILASNSTQKQLSDAITFLEQLSQTFNQEQTSQFYSILANAGCVSSFTNTKQALKSNQETVFDQLNISERLDKILEKVYALADVRNEEFNHAATLPQQVSVTEDEFTYTSLDASEITKRSSILDSCITFLPWQALTLHDLHVLTEVNNSLNTGNLDQVVYNCEILCNQLIQDTPAEVLIQRPSIVHTLFSLISRHNSAQVFPCDEKSNQIIEACLRVVKSITETLQERVKFHKVKELQCPREGLPFGTRHAAILRSHAMITGNTVLEHFSNSISLVSNDNQTTFNQSLNSSCIANTTLASSSFLLSASNVSAENSEPSEFGFEVHNTSSNLSNSNVDLETAFRNQLSLPQFCGDSLSTLTRLLASATTEQCLHINRAINSVLELTTEIIDVSKLWAFSDRLLTQGDLISHVRKQFLDCIENVANAVIKHYPFNSPEALKEGDLDYSWLGPSECKEMVELSDHALVYQGVANMFNKVLVTLFTESGPAYQVASRLSIRRALKLISVDRALGSGITSVVVSILGKYFAKILLLTQENSRFKTQIFLKNFDDDNHPCAMISRILNGIFETGSYFGR